MSRSYSRSQSRSNHSRSNSPRRRHPDDQNRDLKGTVCNLQAERGFGFIKLGEGFDKDIFFHTENIVDGIDIRQLRINDKVTIDLVPSKKKRDRMDAVNIRPEDSETKNRDSYVERRRGGSRSRDRGRRGGGYYDRSRSRERNRRGRSRSRERGRYY